jgi:hypothetical protein
MPDIFLHCGACDTTRPYGEPCKCSRSHDPWVVVGTTTIDGTTADVVASIGGDWLDLSRMWEPRQIGGRWVRPVSAASLLGDTETQDAFTVMRMEIVRRQSEIDVEAARAKSAAFREFLDDLGPERLSEPACPECGPHGNAGRVFLLESRVDCTTCRPEVISVDVHLSPSQRLLDHLEPGADAVVVVPEARSEALRGERHLARANVDAVVTVPTKADLCNYLEES